MKGRVHRHGAGSERVDPHHQSRKKEAARICSSLMYIKSEKLSCRDGVAGREVDYKTDLYSCYDASQLLTRQDSSFLQSCSQSLDF